MPAMRRGRIASALAVIACAAFAATAFGGEAPVNIQGSKFVDKNYSSKKSVGVPNGGKRVVYLRVLNTTNSTENATLTETQFESSEYKISWYKGKKPNSKKKITKKVRGSGYDFKAKPGKRYFTVKIRNPNNGGPLCLRADLNYAAMFDVSFFGVNGSDCL